MIDVKLSTKTNIPADDMQLLSVFDRDIYDDMPLPEQYQCQFHYISQPLVNNRQKTSADGICFSLRVISVFSLLLLLLFSVNLLSSEFFDSRKLALNFFLTAGNSALSRLRQPYSFIRSENCEVLRSACLSVCLSLRPLAYLRNRIS